jgi:diguanylate cyclase (GGDEF)-like protein/PAS domain S-box-containing protein
MTSFAPVHASYNFTLVAVSVALGIFASYAALDLAGLVASATGRIRIAWLSAGAVAMGLGIWSMHYVGMLALNMGMPVYYHVPTVVISLLAAVFASAVALSAVSRPRLNPSHQILGSVSMGAGIAGMHYIGMAAMRCSAVAAYNWKIVAFSIVLAIAISEIAMRLAFRMRRDHYVTLRKVASALVMGSAISLMHYTGMWAASFTPSTARTDLTRTIGISTVGAFSISVTSIFVLLGAIATSFLDKFMSAHRGDLSVARERELYFQTMAEAIPEIIWTADPDGAVDYCNQNMLSYSGKMRAQLQGAGWADSIHPDDLTSCLKEWNTALSAGKAYETQYRILKADGTFRWFLCRANPIRDDQGAIVKWFGTCTDIENQKLNERILEEQILERTMQLADANTRLLQEMAEKDLARRQLDEEHDRMMSDLEKRSERATMLAKMGELLQSAVSRDEVIAIALGFAPKIFPSKRGSIILLNSCRTLAEVAGSWDDCLLPGTEFEAAECWASRTGHPHLVEFDDATARCLHAKGVQNSYLCIPVLAQGETLGILHLQAKEDRRHLDPSELSFSTTFAGQIGLSIANINLRDALRTQSLKDALTGLHNRRYLEETLEREIRRATRSKQNLGVIMIDLDHFKKFNDAFGHDAGDAVLRETGLSLTKSVRAEDFICRFGGEEFVVILPTASLEATQARAENLRLNIRELTILYQGKSMGMITISAGVAVFPDHGATPKDIITAADAALYEAKRNGRDQVAVAATHSSGEIGLSNAAPAGV